MTLPIPANEALRLEALLQHHILDTAPEEAFDDLTRLAAYVCEVPISAVSLIDEGRQWFKSILGLEVLETPREAAFCAHTILEPGLLIVPDARKDQRFAANPLVTGDPYIRFYAGAPLLTPDGHALGSLCVIDQVPRKLTPDQEAALRMLARQAARQLELTRRTALQEQLTAETQRAEAILRDSEERFRSSVNTMEEGLVLRDADGAILMCNDSAERILELPAKEMIGRTSLDPFGHAVREDGSDFPNEEHPARVSLREGIPQRGIVMGIHTPSGALIWVLINTIPLFHPGETQPYGVVSTFSDITARKHSEEDSARLAAIVASSHDAILAVTLDGTLISWNRGAEELYGYAPELIIGQHASVLAPPEECGFIGSVIQAIMQGEKRENIEVKRQRTDGTWIAVSITFSPIKNAAAQIVGIAAIGRDITEQKHAEKALRDSENSLRTVMEGAPIVLYATDSLGIVTLSEGAGLARLGLAPGEVVGQSVFEMYQNVPEILSNLEKALAGEAISYEIVLNGLCYHNDVRPQRDQNGHINGIIAVAYDMTERWRAEEALRQSQESLEQSQAMAHVSSWAIDCRSGDRYWSPEMFRIFGLPPAAEPPPAEWYLSIVHPDDHARTAANLQEARTHGTLSQWEYRIIRQDGQERHLQVLCEPVRDECGSILALRGTALDITERKIAEQALKDFSVVLEFQKQELEKTNAELESLAMKDGLTGLRNRRSFDTRLQEEFERAVRYHSPLSLVLLDIDRFKQYNDTFGHLAGDEVLRQVGDILQNKMRETDLLCRYGGEEIAIIMPETDHAGAMQVAERVREAIATAAWDNREITVSLGVSTLGVEMDNPQELVAGADRALYHSKASGRNCTTHERGYDTAPSDTSAASLESASSSSLSA